MMDAAGEEGERFDEPLDVRIDAAVRFKHEPASGARELLGELLREDWLERAY